MEVIHSEQVRNKIAWTTGNEPLLLNQFKANMVFFEDDGDDVADIIMEVRDKNCGSGSVVLGVGDVSTDQKKMVRLSRAQAAGKALCVRVRAWYIPPGETRRVQVFMNYSKGIYMR